MEKNDLKKIMALLAELYPNQPKPNTRERLAAWWLILNPCPYNAVKDAVLAHARRCEYYPTPSEIARAITERGGDVEDRNGWMDEVILYNERRRQEETSHE